MAPKVKIRSADMSQARFERELPESIQRLLVSRGLYSDSDLDLRLATLESPSSLKGLDKALDLLISVLKEQRKVLVCGDYDADGATATALLIRVLKAFGLEQIDFLVPNRFDFGYGLSLELVEVAQGYSPDLIITVDNGISSIDGVARAKQLGIQVLITDHHLPGPELPNAEAILNPNQPDCGFPSKNLAGVGVVFYLLIALRAALREQNWFQEQGIAEPRLEDFLDIVALGTVSDLVPLDRLNRVLVYQGLKKLKSGRGNTGIRSLFEVSGRDYVQAQSTDLGFAIGPRINAAGRLDDITEGILCLLTDDPSEAHSHAMHLHQINQQRRQIQEQMLIDAERALAKQDLEQADLPWGYCCYEESWHQGLVGLVAARIKEKIHRPAIAFAPDEDGEHIKGSARSISGLHIRDCLEYVDTQHRGLIKKFGGHAMAAGLTIAADDYQKFADAFDQAVRLMVKEEDLEATIWSDGELETRDIKISFAQMLEDLIPWGQRVPEPQFNGVFEVVEYRWLKETHLKLRLRAVSLSEILDAIWFNAPALALESKEDSKENSETNRLNAVYQLSINRYMGRESLQLMIQHGEMQTT